MTIEKSQEIFFQRTGEVITRDTIETLFTDPIKARDILMNDPSIHKTYRDIINVNVPSDINDAILNHEKWEPAPWYKAVFHDAFDNRKFISKDGGYRAMA